MLSRAKTKLVAQAPENVLEYLVAVCRGTISLI